MRAPDRKADQGTTAGGISCAANGKAAGYHPDSQHGAADSGGQLNARTCYNVDAESKSVNGDNRGRKREQRNRKLEVKHNVVRVYGHCLFQRLLYRARDF